MIDLENFKQKFQTRFDSTPMIFSAPGRVNLIGEHTDYNDGFVMPFAIDRGTFVAVSPNSDDVINVHTLTLDKTAQISLDDLQGSGKADWTTYIAGMSAVLRRQGLRISGYNMLIDSDIPFGAGLSSSAALEIAVGLAVTALDGGSADIRQLAFAGQKVENEFIGVRSGIMDQFASGLSQKDKALLIDCRNLAVEYVPLDLDDAMLAVCDTEVKHSLASTAYNERRSECERGVEIFAKQIPGVSSLRDVSLDDFHVFEDRVPEPIKRRCRHVITENIRTLKASDALRDGDLTMAGRLMNLSHESLRDDYEVSCAELDLLVETASAIDGVYGARMTGGGFGGSTINLLDAAIFVEFKTSIVEKYESAFGRRPAIFPVSPSKGAMRVL
jgi:galactokinase